MVELSQFSLSPAATILLASSNVADEVILIAAMIQAAPAKLADAARQIQISGTLTQMPDKGQFVLHTAQGDITFTLPPAVQSKIDIEALLQIFAQNQKPLTLVLQPNAATAAGGVQVWVQLPVQGLPKATQDLIRATLGDTALIQGKDPLTSVPLPLRADVRAEALASPFAPEPTLKAGTVFKAVVLPNQVQGAYMALSNATYAPPPVPLYPSRILRVREVDQMAPSPPPPTSSPVASGEAGKTVDAASSAAKPAEAVQAVLSALAKAATGTRAASVADPVPLVPKSGGGQGTPSPVSDGGASATAGPVSSILGERLTPAQAAPTTGPVSPVSSQKNPLVAEAMQHFFTTKSGTGHEQTSGALAPSSAEGAMRATEGPVSSAAPQQWQPLKAGVEMRFRVVAFVDKPAELLSSFKASLPPTQRLATVIGNGPGGQLLLNLDDTTLFVRQTGHLPMGTQMLIEKLAQDHETLPLLTAEQREPLVEKFSSFLTLLQQADPGLMQKVMQTHLPHTGQALGGGLLFLLSALNKGAGAPWLDDVISDDDGPILKRGLDQLREAMASTSGTVRDPVVGEWRSFPLPLMDQGQLQMLRLYVRDDPSQGEGGRKLDRAESGRTRFVINLSPSRLGPMQLDGLVQKKQLDMVIRSEHPLPAALHDDLRALYAKTLSAFDFAGHIVFQTGRNHWLNLQAAAPTTGLQA